MPKSAEELFAAAQEASRQRGQGYCCFAEQPGVEIAETKLPKLGIGDLGGGWNDWIIDHSLFREAKMLIEGQPATASDQPNQK